MWIEEQPHRGKVKGGWDGMLQRGMEGNGRERKRTEKREDKLKSRKRKCCLPKGDLNRRAEQEGTQSSGKALCGGKGANRRRITVEYRDQEPKDLRQGMFDECPDSQSQAGTRTRRCLSAGSRKVVPSE